MLDHDEHGPAMAMRTNGSIVAAGLVTRFGNLLAFVMLASSCTSDTPLADGRVAASPDGGAGIDATSHLLDQGLDGLDYVPRPDPADTGDFLIGAFYMPAWNMAHHWAWPTIEDYPDRKPLLGYFDEGHPEAMDWEIKWAREHGISFFVFDWFRIRCPGPCPDTPDPISVQTLSLGHALHDGFLRSRYGDGDDPSDMKFAVMLTAHHPWVRALYSAQDTEETLVPFLVAHYFERPNYLKIDGKPVLFHYDSNAQTQAELGSEQNILETISALRRATVTAGFPGLILLGENRNPDSTFSYQRLRDLGFDYLHSYVWGAPTYAPAPTDEQGIAYQMDAMRSRIDADVIPFVPGATMGWDSTPLGPSNVRWKLRPNSYNELLRNIKTMMNDVLTDSLAKRMLIVGAWNEYSEGHYIAPHQAYRFAYLEQIRTVFSDGQNDPDYRLPSEVGLGPYDSMYQDYIKPRVSRLVVHYPLDGDAQDASGSGLHGTAYGDPQVTSGIKSRAFQFDGLDDHVLVPDHYQLEGMAGLSFGAWVYVDEFRTGSVPFEKDQGYRFVVSDGGSGHCAVATKYHKIYAPETVATFGAGTLSLHTWHHLLCVYDGSSVRVFVDGDVVATSSGTLAGSIQTHSFGLTLGGRAPTRSNWFSGRIDDFRLWNYALTQSEITAAASRNAASGSRSSCESCS